MASRERGPGAPIAPGYSIARQLADAIPLDEVDALLAEANVDVDADGDGPPRGSDLTDLRHDEDTSAEMGGFDGLPADADPDGDFTDADLDETSPLDSVFDGGPAAVRRWQADVEFIPRPGTGGAIRFTVALSPSDGLASRGPDEVVRRLEDLLRIRVDAVRRLAEVLADAQQAFLAALAVGESLLLADRHLTVLTQEEVGRRAGLSKDAVSTLARVTYGSVRRPGRPLFRLVRLMGRSRSLGVHPDALAAHVRQEAPRCRSVQSLLERLWALGVLRRPADATRVRTMRESVRQVCAKTGVSFSDAGPCGGDA